MTTAQDTVAFLEKVSLFQGLSKRQLEQMAKQFVERRYEAGQEIVTQGKKGEGFFVVVHGAAEAVRERLDGTKSIVNTFGPTDFFGEMALLDDGVRTASIITKEPTVCLALTRWDFHAVLREDADMSISILEELAKRFRKILDTM